MTDTEAFDLDFAKAEWDSGWFCHRVDDLMAGAIGWVEKLDNQFVWWDERANRAAPYSRRRAPGEIWNPCGREDHMYFAVELIHRRRKATFSLTLLDVTWTARFDTSRSEVIVSRRHPNEAICEAVVRAGQRFPDPESVFRY